MAPQCLQNKILPRPSLGYWKSCSPKLPFSIPFLLLNPYQASHTFGLPNIPHDFILRAVLFPLFVQLVLSLFPATFPSPLITIDKTQILYSQWSVWGSHSYWSTFSSIPPWHSAHVINYYHPFNFIPIFQPRIREGNPGTQHKQAWHTISTQCYFVTLSSLMYSNKSSPSFL